MKNTKLGTRIAAASIACAVVLGGCGKVDNSATLVTIDDGKDKIEYGYGYFLARYTQTTYDAYYRAYFGDSYWSQDNSGEGKTMEESTLENVLDTLEEQYLCKQHGGDYDVEVTDEQEKAIKEAAKKFMKDNSKEGIAQIGATEDYLIDLMTYQTYANGVSAKVKDEADVKVTAKEANQSKISYVEFDLEGETDDSTGEETPLTDEEIKEAEDNAKKVAKASDFEKAVEDAGGTVETATYTTSAKASEASDDLPEEVVAAAQKLKKGEISKAIEVEDDGWYVVRLDSTKDKDATKTKKEELLQEKKDDYYESKIKEWKKDIKWKVDKKLWKHVKYDSLFEVKMDNEASEDSD